MLYNDTWKVYGKRYRTNRNNRTLSGINCQSFTKKVSYIKRKLIIATTLCVSLLAGCGQTETSSASGLVIPFESNTQSIARPESSSVSSAAGSSSENIPITPPDFSISEKTGTFFFSKDPGNPITVTFGDNVITVTAKGNACSGVQKGRPDMKVAREIGVDSTVYTLTPTSDHLSSGFGKFYIIDKNNYLGEVYFAVKDGKIAAPALRELAENNQSVLDSVVNSTSSRVAQAMTMDGSVDKIPEIWKEIEKISNEICDGIDDDYEKLRAIADWVSDNIYYDRPAVSRGEPPSCLTLEYMLNNRSSVCGGYANMTAALCNAQGIRCISITGKALIDGQTYLSTNLEGGLHEWNVAEINGRQIIVDSCWMSANNLSYSGNYSHKDNVWKWFDTGDEIFAVDHQAKTAEYKDFKTLAENIGN